MDSLNLNYGLIIELKFKLDSALSSLLLGINHKENLDKSGPWSNTCSYNFGCGAINHRTSFAFLVFALGFLLAL